MASNLHQWLAYAHEEVAREGLDGCTVDALFKCLSKRIELASQNAPGFVLDHFQQSLVFSHLTKSRGILFFVCPSNHPEGSFAKAHDQKATVEDSALPKEPAKLSGPQTTPKSTPRRPAGKAKAGPSATRSKGSRTAKRSSKRAASDGDSDGSVAAESGSGDDGNDNGNDGYDDGASDREEQPAQRPSSSQAKKLATNDELPRPDAIPVDSEILRQMSLSAVQDTYGASLILRAPRKLIELECFGGREPASKAVSNHLRVLALILKGRANGVTQVELSRMINMTPTSTYAIIKPWVDEKIIYKVKVSLKGVTKTNLLIHHKFIHQNDAYQSWQIAVSSSHHDPAARLSSFDGATSCGSDRVQLEAWRCQVTHLLSAAKNQVLNALDLLQLSNLDASQKLERRWFLRQIVCMQRGGYVQLINIPKRENGEIVHGYQRCVRLCKPYIPLEAAAETGASPASKTLSKYQKDQQSTDPDRDLIIGKGSIAPEMHVEWQVFHVIEASGVAGAIAAVITRSLNNLGDKIIERILFKLCSPVEKKNPNSAPVIRVGEWFRREHRYRYFTREAFEKKKDSSTDIQPNEWDRIGAFVPSILEKRKMEHRLLDVTEDGSEQLTTPKKSRIDEMDPTATASLELMKEEPRIGCQACHSIGVSRLITCNHCSSQYHFSCCNPPLKSYPTSLWYCSKDCGSKATLPSNVLTFDSSVEAAASVASPSASQRVRGSSQLNITQLERRQLLLEIIQELEIVECGTRFELYYMEQYAKKHGKELGYRIDRATFRRLAASMEQDGQLKVYNVQIPRLNGKHYFKMLLIRNDIDTGSERVREYVRNLVNRNVESSVSKKVRLQSLPVDDDLVVERVFVSQQPLTVTTWQTGQEDHEPLANQSDNHDSLASQSSHKQDDYSGDTYWSNVAATYGWISAKYIRAKVFHRFILSMILDQRAEDTSPDNGSGASASSKGSREYKGNGVLDIAKIIREMPLETMLSLVSITVDHPPLREYIQSAENRSKKMCEVDPKVLNFDRSITRIKSNIRLVIETLEMFKVLERSAKPLASYAVEGNNQVAEFRLCKIVPVYNYTDPNQPYLKSFDIDSYQSFQGFWSYLQFICETFATRTRKREHPATSPKSHKGMPLHEIVQNPRNWRQSYQFGPREKECLNGYIIYDGEVPKVPLNNDSTLLKIARDHSLPLEKIKFYYRGVIDDYQKRLNFQERQANQNKISRLAKIMRRSVARKGKAHGRRAKRNAGDSNSDSDSSGDETWRDNGHGHSTSSHTKDEASDVLSPRRSTRQRGLKSRDDLVNIDAFESRPIQEHVPVITDVQTFNKSLLFKKTRYRYPWSAEEDNLLIYGYVIMASLKCKMSWHPLRTLFLEWNKRHNTSLAPFLAPEEYLIQGGGDLNSGAEVGKRKLQGNADTLRRRLIVLLKSTDLANRIHRLSEYWKIAYLRGVGAGKFEIIDVTVPKTVPHLQLIDYVMFLKAKWESEDGTDEGASALRYSSVLNERNYLPATVALLEEQFQVVKSVGFAGESTVDVVNKPVFALGQQNSVRSQLLAMYSQSMSGLLYYSGLVDDTTQHELPDLDTDINLESKLIKAVLMSVLATQDSEYDSEKAMMILARYSDQQLANATSMLHEHGSICRSKLMGPLKRLPGRGYQISEKFLHVLTGVWPKTLFQEAKEFYAQLQTELPKQSNTVYRFEPLLKDGCMMVLLDLMGYRRLTPKIMFEKSPIDSNMRMTGRRSMYRLAHEEDSVVPIFSDLDDDTAMSGISKSQPCSQAYPPIDESLLESQDPSDPAIDTIRRCGQENAEHVAEVECALYLYATIVQAGRLGISLLNIKRQAQQDSVRLSDSQLRLQVDKLSALRHPRIDISIVAKVGYLEERYVSHRYLDAWTISINCADQDLQSMWEKQVQRGQDALDYVQPKLWTSINGQENSKILRMCLQTLSGAILRSPGVLQSQLYQWFSTVLTYTEMLKLLDILVDQGVCRRQYLLKPKAIQSILDDDDDDDGDGRFYRECDANVIDENKLTCYYPEESFFLSVQHETGHLA
ncbi:uncharacterized protein BJ171DRAFT_490241 [Polychytrium aggregatum]|uniref:uncharacterized protein n=1 Tax=Polychytrium aggregatum TaxID=110093 RepID=UPI0022FEAEF8|nr:uncharacterized protein BJ171DRAFT_490241 [Polychytrium aggregatum]KAI9208105.1 hypothetical protein BJ171DRAFT_490241 [Polychytrium aggregatum]